jgi:hypothetical protein
MDKEFFFFIIFQERKVMDDLLIDVCLEAHDLGHELVHLPPHVMAVSLDEALAEVKESYALPAVYNPRPAGVVTYTYGLPHLLSASVPPSGPHPVQELVAEVHYIEIGNVDVNQCRRDKKEGRRRIIAMYPVANLPHLPKDDVLWLEKALNYKGPFDIKIPGILSIV